MLEADRISMTTDLRSTLTVVAPSADRSAAAFAKSPPFTGLLVNRAGGFDLTLLRGLHRLRSTNPSAEVRGRIMIASAALGAMVTRGVTNRQIALDCLSTRPVPSASQDVRAGFLFGGCW